MCADNCLAVNRVNLRNSRRLPCLCHSRCMDHICVSKWINGEELFFRKDSVEEKKNLMCIQYAN